MLPPVPMLPAAPIVPAAPSVAPGPGPGPSVGFVLEEVVPAREAEGARLGSSVLGGERTELVEEVLGLLVVLVSAAESGFVGLWTAATDAVNHTYRVAQTFLNRRA